MTDQDPGSVEATGRFRVYLGAAPGVGKTYSMLCEGRRRRERGADVAIGFVECHGRQSTEELIDDLEVIRRRVVEYRGSRFEEMDLDAVLERHPQVVLVDELAHTNVPGSGGHQKRWEDVVDLLDAEVDVIATVNIQHLESIADAVERIIEVPIWERVPDWVLRKADQIELVDSSPEQLRRRMLHGNIYPADRVPEALNHYFRTDNLTALRELALRFLADETEDQFLEYLRGQRKDAIWDTHERALQQLSADVGAAWHQVRGDDPAEALLDFARRRHVTQIVVGSSSRSRFKEMLGGGSTVRRISRLAASAAIDVHIIARRQPDPESAERAEASG